MDPMNENLSWYFFNRFHTSSYFQQILNIFAFLIYFLSTWSLYSCLIDNPMVIFETNYLVCQGISSFLVVSTISGSLVCSRIHLSVVLWSFMTISKKNCWYIRCTILSLKSSFLYINTSEALSSLIVELVLS